MSAFLVSRNHITALIAAAQKYELTEVSMPMIEAGQARHGGETIRIGSLSALGETLWLENHKSVKCRYDAFDTDKNPNPPPSYTFRRDAKCPPALEVLKAIACFEYQTSEHPGWKTSFAFQFCQELRAAVCQGLPGWDAAPWAID